MFVALAAVAISAISSIAQGISANNAAQSEADFLEQQAHLTAAEFAAEAARVRDQNRKFMKRQKLAFLKNGVTLDGSPLFILEETLEEGQKEVNAIAARGTAIAASYFQRADSVRDEGRNALIGGFTNAATTVFSAFTAGSQAGLFSKGVTASEQGVGTILRTTGNTSSSSKFGTRLGLRTGVTFT